MRSWSCCHRADQARPRLRRPQRGGAPPGDQVGGVHRSGRLLGRLCRPHDPRASRPLRARAAEGGPRRRSRAGGLDERVWRLSSTGLGGRVHLVGHGDAVSVAGIDVTVHGELHAEIHPEIPRSRTSGSWSPGKSSTRATRSPSWRSRSLRCSCRCTPVVADGGPHRLRAGGARGPGVRRALRPAERRRHRPGREPAQRAGPVTPTPFSRLAPGDSAELSRSSQSPGDQVSGRRGGPGLQRPRRRQRTRGPRRPPGGTRRRSVR